MQYFFEEKLHKQILTKQTKCYELNILNIKWILHIFTFLYKLTKSFELTNTNDVGSCVQRLCSISTTNQRLCSISTTNQRLCSISTTNVLKLGMHTMVLV